MVKSTDIPQPDLKSNLESLVKQGILINVQSKYQVNPDFNKDQRSEFISFLPSVEDLKQQDSKKIESLNLSSISGDGDDSNTTDKHLQTKFMETLKFRIDSRIIKHLKHKKTMKY